MPNVGVIAIGRNEGERLRRCLASVTGRGRAVVYVDSASTDGSAELARSMGAEVVDLDMSLPFSAARARNEGFARLMQVAPHWPSTVRLHPETVQPTTSAVSGTSMLQTRSTVDGIGL